MVEVSELKFAKFPNAPTGYNPLLAGRLDLQISFRNYGGTWARDVVWESVAYVGQESQGLNDVSNQQLRQIAPGAEVTVNFTVAISRESYDRIFKGQPYRVRVGAQYRAPTGTRTFRYATVRALNQSDLSFTVESNGTDQVA